MNKKIYNKKAQKEANSDLCANKDIINNNEPFKMSLNRCGCDACQRMREKQKKKKQFFQLPKSVHFAGKKKRTQLKLNSVNLFPFILCRCTFIIIIFFHTDQAISLFWSKCVRFFSSLLTLHSWAYIRCEWWTVYMYRPSNIKQKFLSSRS